MRTFIVQLSGLAGLGIFLNHLWTGASLERTLLVSFSVGLAVYLILSLSDSVIRRLMVPPPDEPELEEAKIKSESVAEEENEPSPQQTIQA